MKYLSRLSQIPVLCFMFVFTQLQAQQFSGELHYTLKIIPKIRTINADSLLALEQGTSSVYLITDRYYKSTYFRDGKQTYSYTYHDETKRMYDESSDKAYITFRDSRRGNASLIRSIVYKDSIKIIQGHRCFMVERVYETYISKIYYAMDLKINPESFKGHEVGNWYQQIKDVNGALSLMSVNEYVTHVEVNEVIKLVPRLVKREEFDLPKKKVVASVQALDKKAEFIQPTQSLIDCYRKKMGSALEEVEGPVNYTSYIELIVSEEGVISDLSPVEKDEYEFYKVGMDIIISCGFAFTPGEIEGKPISSVVYFPFEFQK